MTRFARKQGLAEKKENTRKIEEATEWDRMFVEKKVNPDSNNNTNEDESHKLKKHEEDYDKRIKLENSNTIKKPKKHAKSDAEYEKLLKKHSETIDKEVLADLVEMKRKKHLNKDEFLDRVIRESRSNLRRLGRINNRETKTVCFNCRLPGHALNDCPKIKQDNEQGTGICYKCGSTEHSVNKCKVKVEPGYFPYAKCFICHETGHITKQCPDNPRGLYPNGGACKHCASVEHYARDCPEAQKKEFAQRKYNSQKVKAKG